MLCNSNQYITNYENYTFSIHLNIFLFWMNTSKFNLNKINLIPNEAKLNFFLFSIASNSLLLRLTSINWIISVDFYELRLVCGLKKYFFESILGEFQV